MQIASDHTAEASRQDRPARPSPAVRGPPDDERHRRASSSIARRHRRARQSQPAWSFRSALPHPTRRNRRQQSEASEATREAPDEPSRERLLALDAGAFCWRAVQNSPLRKSFRRRALRPGARREGQRPTGERRTLHMRRFSPTALLSGAGKITRHTVEPDAGKAGPADRIDRPDRAAKPPILRTAEPSVFKVETSPTIVF